MLFVGSVFGHGDMGLKAPATVGGRYNSTTFARSRYAQNAFANCICRGLLHSGSNRRGLPTTITAVIEGGILALMSLIAWTLFGVLLIGRIRFGWRGRSAVQWTLSGFGVLAVAYFGVKFVLEDVLGRHWG